MPMAKNTVSEATKESWKILVDITDTRLLLFIKTSHQ